MHEYFQREFVSDAALRADLTRSELSPEAQDAVVAENASARLVGLRTALAVVALVTVVAIGFARLLPTESLAGAGAGAASTGRRRRRRGATSP